jgi:tRNA pseudouridine55 synthase
MKRKGTGPDALVIVDKPAGITSHGVVSRLRRLAGTRRVGHAGTLDPMATGVLVIGVEKATRLLGHLALTEKAYDATIRLGRSTITDDAEGEVTATVPTASVTPEAVAEEVGRLTGDILQVPSKVSAIKVDGRRSYNRVRSGEDVDLPARPVTVRTFTVHALRPVTLPDGTELLDLDVSVECSSGTYIRALARDLGAALGVGGHLTALRRTRVGPYTLKEARTLVELEESLTALPLSQAAAAAFPRRDVTEEEARLVSNGVRLKAAGLGEGPIALFAPGDRFVALVEERDGQARSLAVFT